MKRKVRRARGGEGSEASLHCDLGGLPIKKTMKKSTGYEGGEGVIKKRAPNKGGQEKGEKMGSLEENTLENSKPRKEEVRVRVRGFETKKNDRTEISNKGRKIHVCKGGLGVIPKKKNEWAGERCAWG